MILMKHDNPLLFDKDHTKPRCDEQENPIAWFKGVPIYAPKTVMPR